MRCPVCAATEKPHNFHASRTTQRAGTVHTFWDKHDALHIHDEGEYHTRYTCDDGHQFDEIRLSRCPVLLCEWNKKPEVVGTMRGS